MIRPGLVALVSGVVALGAAWTPFVQYRIDDARATREADAVIVAVDEVDEDSGQRPSTLEWTDGAGRLHRTVFPVSNPEDYPLGATYPIRYDPARPDGRVVSADPDEYAQQDAVEEIGFVPTLFGGIPLLVWWLVRGAGLLRARRGAPRQASVEVMTGWYLSERPSLAPTTWLRLQDEAGSTAYQRVGWHDDLAAVTDGSEVTVTGDMTRRRGVGVVLPSGARLHPTGSVRRRPPGKVILLPRREDRLSTVDAFVGKADPRPPRRWLAVKLGALGAIVGLLFIVQPWSAVIASICGAAAGLNIWALRGGDP